MSEAVVWHDLECHGYTADLGLWRELAASAGGPILDIGAGTGRVAIDLAGRGHEVVALDLDPALLTELRRRCAAVETIAADAADFDLGRRFPLILVPMQTVQLLPDRRGLLDCARAHLEPGGRLAIAIAAELEPYEGAGLPLPDVIERDGWRFASQPVALRSVPGAIRIERIRTTWHPEGTRTFTADAIELAVLDAATLEAEAAAAGFAVLDRRAIPATDEHVGSQVVILAA